MFPFTKPLGPNFSHLYLAAYICAYATVEPVLETIENMKPCIRWNGRKSQGTQRKPNLAELKRQAERNKSTSDVTFEEVENGFVLVDTRSEEM